MQMRILRKIFVVFFLSSTKMPFLSKCHFPYSFSQTSFFSRPEGRLPKIQKQNRLIKHRKLPNYAFTDSKRNRINNSFIRMFILYINPKSKRQSKIVHKTPPTRKYPTQTAIQIHPKSTLHSQNPYTPKCKDVFLQTPKRFRQNVKEFEVY